MKKRIFWLGCFLLLNISLFSQTLLGGAMTSTQKIILQSQIEREANTLVKEGRYEEAVRKYEEAMDPSLLNREGDEASALQGILSIRQWQKRFLEAQKIVQWFGEERPKSEIFINGKSEIEAFLESLETKSADPLYRYISDLRERYKRMLPPFHEESLYTSRIIRIYDYLGDQASGIAFCDMVLKYWEKKSGQDLHRPGNKDPYFLVRQAFEQDKAEGFKGCLDAKPGDVCMGRATRAIIQSDYFPW